MNSASLHIHRKHTLTDAAPVFEYVIVADHEIIAKGEIKGFDRARGWQPLLALIAEEVQGA